MIVSEFMPNTFPGTLTDWIALLGGIVTIIQFVIIVIQISRSMKRKEDMNVILSTIFRLGSAIRSKTSSCQSADIIDKEVLLSYVEASTNAILIEIEEFRKHRKIEKFRFFRWKKEPPGNAQSNSSPGV